MSKQNIYNTLRKGGLSHIGTCAVMGNMYCESTLKSNIVEKRCTMTDEQYTAAVDNGGMFPDTFQRDAFGYGLCQWTFWTRKQELYNKAKLSGVSIGDETMQCNFCIDELKRDYPGLYSFLCTTNDLYSATSRVCCEYERPAVNNVQPRYEAAKGYDSEFSGVPITDTPAIIQPVSVGSTESCTITVRKLRNGDKGRDVLMFQHGLNDLGLDGINCGRPDGLFGGNTSNALNKFKSEMTWKTDGIVDEDVWQFLFQ